MNFFLLLEAQQEMPDNNALLLQYLIYLGVIVLSVIGLILLRKFTRLPNHTEVQRRLEQILSSLQEYAASPQEASYGAFASMGKLHYALDKLSYTTSLLSQKERDGDLGTVSDLLERASNLLMPLKLSKPTPEEEEENLAAALENVQNADDLLTQIIARDRTLKKKYR